MKPHRFEPGQRVTLASSPFAGSPARGNYQVVRQLPPRGDDNQYRIKSDSENFERVAGESQLSAVGR